MIIKMLKFRKDEYVVTSIISLAAFILGCILLCIILNVSHSEETTFEIGTIMSLMVIIFVSLFMGASVFAGNFNLAVSMGVTRRQFFISYFASSAIILVAQLVMVYILHFIEKTEISMFYSQYVKEAGPELFLFSAYVIPAILLLIAIQMFFGFMTLRYGKKAFWVIWAIWMVVCFLPSRISNSIENAPDSVFAKIGFKVVDIIKNMSSVTGCILLIAGAAVLLIVSHIIGRKQAVKQY